MEYLKRKIKVEREEDQNNMTTSLINNRRLCLRWADKEHPETDILMNFTEKETEKIKEMFD